MQEGKILFDIAVEVGVDQIEAFDVLQIFLREVEAVLFGDAALVGAKKDAVVALERDHGKAVFALKMAAVADVDAQLVQDLLVVGGDLIAAKLAQISGRHTVCCGIGAGVDALAAGVHLPTGKVFVTHIIADGMILTALIVSDPFRLYQYATFHI